MSCIYPAFINISYPIGNFPTSDSNFLMSPLRTPLSYEYCLTSASSCLNSSRIFIGSGEVKFLFILDMRSNNNLS